MGLSGKLTAQIEYKSGTGDVFHEVFRYKPHEISKMIPELIQGCDLHEGDLGSVGSVIFWKYTHDGKEKVVKEILEAIDEEKKSLKLKVIEGDLMELYKKFDKTFHLETHGHGQLNMRNSMRMLKNLLLCWDSALRSPERSSFII